MEGNKLQPQTKPQQRFQEELGVPSSSRLGWGREGSNNKLRAPGSPRGVWFPGLCRAPSLGTRQMELLSCEPAAAVDRAAPGAVCLPDRHPGRDAFSQQPPEDAAVRDPASRWAMRVPWTPCEQARTTDGSWPYQGPHRLLGHWFRHQ